MARTYVDLQITNMVKISSAAPNTRETGAKETIFTLVRNEDGSSQQRAYFGFQALPSSLKRKRLYNYDIGLDGYTMGEGTKRDVFCYASLSAPNYSQLTWNNRPGGSNALRCQCGYDFVLDDPYDHLTFRMIPSGDTKEKSDAAAAVLKSQSFYLLPALVDTVKRIRCAGSCDELGGQYTNFGNPFIRIYYDNAEEISSQIAQYNCITSGYLDPRIAQTFAWTYEDADDLYSCADTFTQASAVFHWRQGTSGSWTDVNVSDNTKQVTIPANTFPAGKTIQWYLSGTDTEGDSSQTEVYTVSTAAGTATATAISPINSVEDGSAPITFRWNLSSTDGQAASRVRAWWKLPSEDNSHWHTLVDTNSAITSYTAAANTFSAGEIQWKVQAFNIDGTEGPWDANVPNQKRFICVAAPDPVSGLTATQVPWTTISWQSDGQEAYEISVDGAVVRKAFGPGVYSWRVRDPLEDGPHTISVRVQGVYGLWSQPSTISITIENAVPSGWDGIELSGVFGLDADLTLNMNGGGMTPPIVQWYRDGKRIAQVRYQADNIYGPFPFVDFRVLGTHQYYAVLLHNNGNYGRSNTISGTMTSDTKQIRALDGSTDWLDLRLTEKSNGLESYQMTQQSVTQHVTGAVWPDVERSPFRDLSASFDCAFRDPAEAAVFETLFGKIVILKSRGDEVVIGMLSQIQKKVSLFYTTYNFSINQIHVNDFTEETL